MSRRGFSLIEVVLALAILSIGIVGAIRVFPVGLRASHRAGLSSLATLAGERTMESLKLKPWEELVIGESASREDPFDIVVSVDQPVLPGLVDPTRVKRLAVTVNWTQEGRSRSLTLATYLHRQEAAGGSGDGTG